MDLFKVKSEIKSYNLVLKILIATFYEQGEHIVLAHCLQKAASTKEFYDQMVRTFENIRISVEFTNNIFSENYIKTNQTKC